MMEEEVFVRPFQVQDQSYVVQLYRDSLAWYTSENSAAGIPSVLKSLADSRCGPDGDLHDVQKTYQTGDKRRNFFVAVDQATNKIVGFVGAIPSIEFNPDEYMELVRMAVDVRYRGVGVGLKLVQAFESWARDQGYGKVNLTTLDGMRPAMRFYPKHGYIECAEKEQRLDLTKYATASGEDAHSAKLVHFVKVL